MRKIKIQRLQKHTSGLYVFIPKAFERANELKAGDEVEIKIKRNILTIKKRGATVQQNTKEGRDGS